MIAWGYETIFQYVGIFMWEFSLEFFVGFFCVTILWYFCVGLLVAGGFIWFPLHMTMVWYLAMGSGNPGTERRHLHKQTSISVDRRGWGFPAPPQGRRPEDIGRQAEEQKPSFLALARKTTSSERSDLLMVGGANEESDGRSPRICSMEPYQITNALNLSEITCSGNLKMVSDRAK